MNNAQKIVCILQLVCDCLFYKRYGHFNMRQLIAIIDVYADCTLIIYFATTRVLYIYKSCHFLVFLTY